MAHYQGRASVCSMSAPDFADFRHDFPWDNEAPSSVVPCDVAYNQPEVWGQCVGTSEGPGAWQLSDSMGVASQDETCDDSSGSRETQRSRGGG